MRRHVEELATALPARGFATAAAVPPGTVLVPTIQRFDLELGDRPRPASDLSSLHALRHVAREWRPEIVHAHGAKAALLALSAFRRNRPLTVVTFHNLWPGGPLTLPLRLLSLRAGAAIAVSDAVRARLLEHGIRPRNLVVIRNGIDLTAFSLAARPPAARPFTAAFVGRLTVEKGVPTLLNAVRLLPESSRARIVVAGDGPLRPEVEAAARTEGRLEYLGHQPAVLAVYHRADVVVIPSMAEGHPLTALEAMACALPVIASRVGGLVETVIHDETGLLLPSGDPAALANAIRLLEEEPERARSMGAAGRRHVEAESSVDRMLDQVVTVYRELFG